MFHNCMVLVIMLMMILEMMILEMMMTMPMVVMMTMTMVMMMIACLGAAHVFGIALDSDRNPLPSSDQ